MMPKQDTVEDNNFRSFQYIPLIVAILVMVLSFALIPAFSPSNDDAYIEQSLAGTGGVASSPTPYTTTINIVLGSLICVLYTICPIVRWWILIQLALIIIALYQLGHTFIEIIQNYFYFNHLSKQINTAIQVITLTVIELGIAGVLIARLQFTSTASFLISVAIITSGFRKNDNENSGKTLHNIIIPVILSVFAFAYRSYSAYIGFIFWGLVSLLKRSVKHKNSDNKIKIVELPIFPLLISLAISALLLGGELISEHLPYQPIENTYSGFAHFVDYPHASFSDDPALYESVDWDDALTELVNKWFMLDSRINSHTLNVLNSANAEYSLISLLGNPIEVIVGRLSAFVQPVTIAYFSILMFLATLNLSRINSSDQRFITIAVVLIPILSLGYLVLQGRLIERAALAILLPAISANGLVLLDNISRKDRKIQKKTQLVFPILICIAVFTPLIAIMTSNLSRFICVMSVLGAEGILVQSYWCNTKQIGKTSLINGCVFERVLRLITCALLIFLPMISAVRIYGWNSSIAANQFYQLENTKAFFNYASEHKNTVYIYSDAQITMQYLGLGEWPKNQTGWGGWRYSYSWFGDAMKEVGLEGKPTSEDLLKDNVCFVTASDDTCELLLKYMKDRFGESVKIYEVDSITDEIKVYKFEKTKS